MSNEKNVNLYSFNDECYVYLKDYKQLKQQYEQLKINWYKLKEYAKDNLYFYSGYQGKDLEIYISIQEILDKMQELEKVNENEKK